MTYPKDPLPSNSVFPKSTAGINSSFGLQELLLNPSALGAPLVENSAVSLNQ